jgi:signal transduction histidine kinase/DNA-binding NarL/FixJ family response regulator/HPt (histidine-containing phosphotransfer) domain-containing protein
VRIRVALAALPVVVLTWLGIGAYLVQKYDAGLDDAVQDSRNLTQAFEENIRRTVEAIDTTVRAVRVARSHDPVHFDLQAWANESGLTRELTLQLSLADRNGIMVASNLGPITGVPASIADRPHFQMTRDAAGDTLFISTPVLGRVSKRWSVQFVRKMFDAGGAFDGVIVASLDPAFLSRFYTSLNIGRGALLLLGSDGIVRSAAPETVASLSTDLSKTPLMKGAAVGANGTVSMPGTADAIERVYSWRRVDPYGLLVVVGISTADGLTGYRSDLMGCVAIGLVVTMLTLLVSTMLARHRSDVMRSREMLRAAVDNISQGLLVVDATRHVPVLNARAAELLELPPHLRTPGFEFDTLLEWQLAAGEFTSHEDTEVRRLVESGGIDRGIGVYRRVRRNGTVLEVRTKVLDTGMAVRTYTDVTDQERTAQVLADARDAAEAAARARSEFLAVMSHEIRTPLNGVIGVAGLLEDMELGPAQRDYVRLIRQSGDHLLELINDILDFSRLEAQRVELEETDFDPRALLSGVVDLCTIQASTKGLRLSAAVDDAVPATVRGDPGRLRQILLNLAGNAVKFTDHGWVGLTLTQEVAPDGQLRLRFAVADSGIGIDPDAVERMFQEFTQMDGSISRRFGGSGLGLAICRRLVELMGGQITVESQPGTGSTFRFDVTLKHCEARAPVAPLIDAERTTESRTTEAGREPGLRVLLAEDNPTNRLVAVRLLERSGHQVDAVGNGVEAIAALARARYDLILMDVMMPDMDGLTATRHIRADQGRHAGIAIVGLTAGSGTDTLEACLEAGMDAVTTKPVTPARLRAAIAEGMAKPRRRPVESGPEPINLQQANFQRANFQQANFRPATFQSANPDPGNARLRALEEMLGADAVAEIVRTFAEDTQANLALMKQAVGRGDSREVYCLAHGITGAARNVGADALAARASALEETAGTMSMKRIDTEIAAMQNDLEAALCQLAVSPDVSP